MPGLDGAAVCERLRRHDPPIPTAVPAAGGPVVRNPFRSVAPYMGGRMDDRRSYVPPFQLGEPLAGGAVGEVVASGVQGLEAGDAVLHDLGWREYALLRASHARKV